MTSCRADSSRAPRGARARFVLALALSLVATAGCDSLAARRPPGSRLEPDIFKDVAAPSGARYIDDHSESFSYRGGTFRSGRFEFMLEGADADAVIDFYRRTMPGSPYDWILEQEDPRESGQTFVFTKNQDRCTVDVDQLPAHRARPREGVRILLRINFRKK